MLAAARSLGRWLVLVHSTRMAETSLLNSWSGKVEEQQKEKNKKEHKQKLATVNIKEKEDNDNMEKNEEKGLQ